VSVIPLSLIHLGSIVSVQLMFREGGSTVQGQFLEFVL
jgi:hypothetical protein